jgi:Fe-S oxidoreductase/nitrate reductase gamma subunit
MCLATLLALPPGPEPTREILGNVPTLSRWIFAVLAAVSLACFCWGIWRRVRIWRLGAKAEDRLPLAKAAARLVREIFLQRRLRGRRIASLAHLLLFSGFVVLLIGTLLIAVEHTLADLLGRPPDYPVFHYGLYYILYELVLDTFGLALIVGCLIFLCRRLARPASLDHQSADLIVLLCLLFLGLSGYAVEGLRILVADTPQPQCSFVGLAVARTLELLGVQGQATARLHLWLWWLHAVPALALVAVFPYTRLLHGIAGGVNLLREPDRLGKMVPVSIEQVEQTGKIGVEQVVDFSSDRLLHLDACVACGLCEEACPAFEAGKPLSPKAVVQDIRRHLESQSFDVLARLARGEQGDLRGELHGEVISAETLWSCTTCSACTDVCPLRVDPLGMITDMRRHLIGIGQLRGAPAAALQKSQRSGNPWGLPQQDRFAWAQNLEVPSVETQPDFEYLYWVGCAASYDRRVQRVARSLIWLLKRAGLRFAVLGAEERCTGESARRMGDEFVFQELAGSNIEVLERHKVRKIVTHCPHCLNSLKNDYPQFGGHYEVVHHTELLASLLREGRLPRPAGDAAEQITYHDPCYLARVGGVTEEPRELIQITIGKKKSHHLIEMDRNRQDTACCGAGGGRMWFDDPVAERIGRGRVAEAVATGAETVAVSCPFCLIMINDGMADQAPDKKVRDVAEILAAALGYGETAHAGSAERE